MIPTAICGIAHVLLVESAGFRVLGNPYSVEESRMVEASYLVPSAFSFWGASIAFLALCFFSALLAYLLTQDVSAALDAQLPQAERVFVGRGWGRRRTAWSSLCFSLAAGLALATILVLSSGSLSIPPTTEASLPGLTLALGAWAAASVLFAAGSLLLSEFLNEVRQRLRIRWSFDLGFVTAYAALSAVGVLVFCLGFFGMMGQLDAIRASFVSGQPFPLRGSYTADGAIAFVLAPLLGLVAFLSMIVSGFRLWLFGYDRSGERPHASDRAG